MDPVTLDAGCPSPVKYKIAWLKDKAWVVGMCTLEVQA
jgi:hypothetical protein